MGVYLESSITGKDLAWRNKGLVAELEVSRHSRGEMHRLNLAEHARLLSRQETGHLCDNDQL